jgi:uncharacterized membrane protein
VGTAVGKAPGLSTKVVTVLPGKMGGLATGVYEGAKYCTQAPVEGWMVVDGTVGAFGALFVVVVVAVVAVLVVVLLLNGSASPVDSGLKLSARERIRVTSSPKEEIQPRR